MRKIKSVNKEAKGKHKQIRPKHNNQTAEMNDKKVFQQRQRRKATAHAEKQVRISGFWLNTKPAREQWNTVKLLEKELFSQNSTANTTPVKHSRTNKS